MRALTSSRATPEVAPTWQCVEDSGTPSLVPVIMTRAALISMLNPRDGVILAIFTPIAAMILCPYSASPATMPQPPRAKVLILLQRSIGGDAHRRSYDVMGQNIFSSISKKYAIKYAYVIIISVRVVRLWPRQASASVGPSRMFEQ